MTDINLPDLDSYLTAKEIDQLKAAHSVELAMRRHTDFEDTIQGFEWTDSNSSEMETGDLDFGEYLYQSAKAGKFKPSSLVELANNNNPGAIEDASMALESPITDQEIDVHTVRARQAAEGTPLRKVFGESK